MTRSWWSRREKEHQGVGADVTRRRVDSKRSRKSKINVALPLFRNFINRYKPAELWGLWCWQIDQIDLNRGFMNNRLVQAAWERQHRMCSSRETSYRGCCGPLSDFWCSSLIKISFAFFSFTFYACFRNYYWLREINLYDFIFQFCSLGYHKCPSLVPPFVWSYCAALISSCSFPPNYTFWNSWSGIGTVSHLTKTHLNYSNFVNTILLSCFCSLRAPRRAPLRVTLRSTSYLYRTLLYRGTAVPSWRQARTHLRTWLVAAWSPHCVMIPFVPLPTLTATMGKTSHQLC